MGKSEPITDREFAAKMSALGVNPGDGPFAVAVSGGPDSMALALLAARWGQIVAVTFDHGLRTGSDTEARQVANWMNGLSIEHEILTWTGDKPASAVQETARLARYRALEAFCRDRDIAWLLLGHHCEDQAETFLMRLARGSGVNGLAAMKALSPPVIGPGQRPILLRPLLTISKRRLVALLRARNQDWISDPSNDDPTFERVRMRRLLPVLAEHGIEAEAICEAARRLGRAKAALDQVTDTWLRKSADSQALGPIRLNRSDWTGWPDDIRLRALSRCLMAAAGRRTPPRSAQLEGLEADLMAQTTLSATLGGCLIRSEESVIWFFRELRDVPLLALRPGEQRNWDGRFAISNRSDRPVEVGALGYSGWATLPKSVREREDIANLPRDACLALPAIFKDGRPEVVPQLNFPMGKTQEIVVHRLPVAWSEPGQNDH